MERSFFPRVSQPTPPAHDTSPLLEEAHPLSNLDPKPYTDASSVISDQRGTRTVSQSSQEYNKMRGPRYKDDARTSTSPSPPRVRIARAYNHNQSIPRSITSITENGIPPPITQSMMFTSAPTRSQTTSTSPTHSRIRFSERSQSPRKTQAQSIYTYPVSRARQIPSQMGSLIRAERALQQELQALLDAQSIGLAKGASVRSPESSESGSVTPTLSKSQYMMDNNGIIPVRQPKPKTIGLRAARRGISKALGDLEALKEAQADVVNTSLSGIASVNAQIKDWQKRSESFNNEIKAIKAGPAAGHIADLNMERTAVQNEIRDLEERLLGLKARESHLSRSITEVQSKQAADLSSFVEGRKAVEGEVERFLHRPGKAIEDTINLMTSIPSSATQADGSDEWVFLDLPPKRRTADMAVTFLEDLSTKLGDLTKSMDVEKVACQEGLACWRNTLEIVHGVENDMRSDMQSSTSNNGLSTLKRQVTRMNNAIDELHSNFNQAEGKGWKLLVCAIGAELEAFKEGQDLLEEVLNKLSAEDTEAASSTTSTGFKYEDSNGLDAMIDTYRTAQEQPGIIDTTSGDKNTLTSKVDNHPKEQQSDDESDDPHPDLLTETDGD